MGNVWEKIAYYYKTNKQFRNKTIFVCSFFILISFLVFIYNLNYSDITRRFLVFLLLLFAFSFVFLYLNCPGIGLGNIDKNMEKLPKKFGNHNVVIQYNPPKGISSSEIGMLYFRKFQSTNIDSILYKWAYEGKIDIVDNGDSKKIIKHGYLSNNVPKYEQIFWDLLFLSKNSGRGKMFVSSKSFPDEYLRIQSEILNELIGKKLVDPCSDKNSIILTDEGYKVFSEIVGYKYFLERCDEKKYVDIIAKESDFIDKNLQFVVALRLNWVFLDKSSLINNQKFEIEFGK